MGTATLDHGSLADPPESDDGPPGSDDDPPGTGGEKSTDQHELTEAELFDLLANQRRRHILHALMAEGEGVEIGTLSQEIAAWEEGLNPEEITSSDRKRVYTALQQSHLPKLDEAGVIEFDRDRGSVEPTPALEDVEIYMDVVRGRDLPWSDYYLGLTALSGALLAGSSLGIGPLDGLSSSAWGAFVVVMFGVFALAHRHYSRCNRIGITEDPPEIDAVSTKNS